MDSTKSTTYMESSKSIDPSSGGAGSSQEGEDRMKRWAERKQQKRQQAAQRKSMDAANKELGLSARGRYNSKADVADLLEQKGLPVVDLLLLGSGTFAEVYKGRWTMDCSKCMAGEVVAVKVMKLNRTRARPSQGNSGVPKWLSRELKTSLFQVHDNLVRVISDSLDSLPYCIVLEYCNGGSLQEVVTGNPKITLPIFTWHHRTKTALDVALGMQHLHGQGIVHRDLKTPNVLLVHPIHKPDDVCHAKVCDFGLARYLPGEEGCQTQLTGQVGSWYFMAPEMFSIEDRCTYDEKVDVYSYGMTIYHMLAGEVMFSGDRVMSQSEFVIFASEGGRPREDAIPASAPEELRVLMKESWRDLPQNRPGFSSIARRLREGQLSLSQPEPRLEDTGHKNSFLGVYGRWLCCASR